MKHEQTILIIGSGGREHALAYKCAQSPFVKQLYVTPGNGGTATELKTENIALAATDHTGLLAFAHNNAVDMVIVGPEVPLAAGIVDLFDAHGIACIGPTQAAAQLESSKTFAKEFMQRHAIPTAAYACFTDAVHAKEYVCAQPLPVVIKADGLAAGKGVVIATTHEQACTTIDDMLVYKKFGTASTKLIIEEYITGQEVSFIIATDGHTIIPLATSCDYKKLCDGDIGPNTGGMGAYSPALWVTTALEHTIMSTIIEPTIDGMADEGIEYTGFLYAGLMITPQGTPYVLEYNCRLGDPETQPLIMRMRSDLVELCAAIYTKTLHTFAVEWDARPAVTVVLTAHGYPDTYRNGDVITQSETSFSDAKIFHAGTRLEYNTLYTNGGRVLAATAVGDTLADARARAYACADTVMWEGKYCRTDIGINVL